MNSLQIRKLTYAALFLALAMVLPFLTGQIPQIGKSLCPMHIPALLCGFLCGWPWGLAVGLIAPLLRSVTFGMPAMFPDAVVMAFELAVYGAVAGILYRLLPKRLGIGRIYIALAAAMLAGRIIYGIVYLCISGLGFISTEVTWGFFWAKAFANPFPGIVLQIVLIPLLVTALEKAGMSLNR
ncbi:MAG: ECF transporter S component [Clostridia bacterium]|nr:ECF transporter S component [Clostridia bacterium]